MNLPENALNVPYLDLATVDTLLTPTKFQPSTCSTVQLSVLPGIGIGLLESLSLR